MGNVCLSIDPGIDTGWALWAPEGHLLECGVCTGFPVKVTRAIIECPQVYVQAQSKGDPNDLITLAVRVGEYKERLQSRGADVRLILPRAWKGTMSKEVHNAMTVRNTPATDRPRILAALQRIPKGIQHNVWDAIGLGRWAFQKGIFP